MKTIRLRFLSLLLLFSALGGGTLCAQQYALYGHMERSRFDERTGSVQQQAAYQLIETNKQFSNQGALSPLGIQRSIDVDENQDPDFQDGLYIDEMDPAKAARRAGRGDVPPGVTPPGVLTPIGDVLFPMLLCALGYLMFVIRRRKENTL